MVESLSNNNNKNKNVILVLGMLAITFLGLAWKQQNVIFEVLDGNMKILEDLYSNMPQLVETSSSTFSKPKVRKLPLADNNNNNNKEKETEKPLNILLLYADDWRFDTLGVAGNPIVKTPVLDRLAKEGVRFAENCVTTSICWISRATLYTGMYLARHKFEMLGRGRTVNGLQKGWEMPKNETIYALLKHHGGYYVGHAGKLGLWLGIDEHRHMDFFINHDGWHYSEIDGKLWHITERNTHDAMGFLRRRPRDKPFFLNVGYFATHAVDGDKAQYLPQASSMKHLYASNDTIIPIPATANAYDKMPYFFGDYNEGRTRWRWRFDRPDKHQTMMKNYYRLASEVDTSVGILLKELERQGVLNETLIIFTTDNGNFHAEHGLADKWYPHQESIKVPLIIKDPRMDPEFVGTTNDDFTLNIDLAPTILKAAGLEPLSRMMGRDMSVLYRQQYSRGRTLLEKNYFDETTTTTTTTTTTPQRKYLPKPYGSPFHTGLIDEWRTEFFYHHPTHTDKNFIPASEALVRKDFKYMYWPDFEYEELFDLNKDPGEVNDLLKNKEFNNTPEVRSILGEMRNRFLELKDWAHRDEEAIIL